MRERERAREGERERERARERARESERGRERERERERTRERARESERGRERKRINGGGASLSRSLTLSLSLFVSLNPSLAYSNEHFHINTIYNTMPLTRIILAFKQTEQKQIYETKDRRNKEKTETKLRQQVLSSVPTSFHSNQSYTSNSRKSQNSLHTPVSKILSSHALPTNIK